MKLAKELLRKTIAILILISIFMPHFSILGRSLITYAIENKTTNNENVEIHAYFEDDNGEKAIEKESEIDKTLKLKIEIIVRNEKGYGGYFEGKIELQNANFEFVEKENADIHVNAGETKTIEKEIRYSYNQNIDNNYLNKKSDVVIKGKYVNSKNTFDIEGKANVIVNWIPEEKVKSEMKMDILTYQDDLLQLDIESKIKDNSYPIKNTKIEIDIPEEIDLDKIENITVHKRTTDGTNGNKEFDEHNYEIDNNKILINIDNIENAKWKKDVSDILVLTMNFKENVEIENYKLKGQDTITLYDGTKLTENSEIEIKDKRDGKVTADIIEEEQEIYKGKIYTGESRIYKTTTQVNVDYIEDVENIEIEEKKAVYISNEEKDANISYVSTTIKKEEFDKIFGEEGYITIEDQDGNIIANINKDSKSDENGNIVIEYGEEIYKIKIMTSKPIAIGALNLEHIKNIQENKLTRDEKRAIKSIKEEIEANEYSIEKKIGLKETKTDATIKLDKLTFRNSEENKDVKIEIALMTNGEDKDLYKNPKFEIVFPKQVSKVSANNNNKIVYGNGLEINNYSIYEKDGKKVLKFELKGDQEKYPSEAIEESKLLINANIEISKNATNSEEEIIFNFTNEKAVELVDEGQKKVKVEIVADRKEEEKNEKPSETKIDDEEAKLEVTYRAEVGENVLENNAEVKSGEVIKYRMTAKNTGNKELKNVIIKGQIPEGTTHVEVNEKVVTYGFIKDDDTELVEYNENGEQFFADDYEYYNETDKKEISKTQDIKPNQSIVLEYEVKVNENIENNKITTNYMTIEHNGKEIVKESKSYKLKTGELEITTIPILRESANAKLQSGYAYEYNVRIKNNTNVVKKNLSVQLNTNSLLKILSIGVVNGDDEYIESYDTTTAKIKELAPKDTAKLIIQARANEVGESELLATISALIKENGETYRSNKLYENVQSVGLKIALSSSNNSEYLKPGDSTTYYIDVKNEGELEANSLWISDYISDKLKIVNVRVNNARLDDQNYDIYEYEEFLVMNFWKPLKPGESAKIEIDAKLPEGFKTSKEIVIENYAKVTQAGLEKESKKIVYKVSTNAKPGEDSYNDYENYDNDDRNENQIGDNYTISGIAWYDENRNGKRDINENTLSGIEVFLIDTKTSTYAKNSFGIRIDTITGENGEYTLRDIPQGDYVVMFRYDTNMYTVTTYMADIAESNTNSDVIERNVKMNGERIKVGATDILPVYGNLSHIDIGLVEAGILSFEVEKTVNKVIVKNKSGTKTYDYNDEDLAKVEIRAKELKGTVVLVEYKIKVKNTGTIGGYAKNIVDYYPKNFRFSEDLNNGWYLKGEDLYNDSIASELIEPGEEIEIPIILSMTMTETNTGLINNIAGIEEAYDVNGNKVTETTAATSSTSETGEVIDGTMEGMADIIIGVRTGEAVNYVVTIITSIILLILATYVIYEIIHKKSIFKR